MIKYDCVVIPTVLTVTPVIRRMSVKVRQEGSNREKYFA